MKKWFAILALLAALVLVIPAYAQTPSRLTSVNVEIWPEYDQAAVLVIYRISMASATTFPTTLNLRVPARAEVYAVAVIDSTSGLLNAAYDRTVSGDWATLKIMAKSSDVQVEYYDTLDKTGTARHIVYQWAGDYAVDGFTVNLQQPLGATNLVTAPPLNNNGIGQDGLTYFGSLSAPLLAGQSYTLTVDYQKATDDLSTTGLPVQPAEPITPSTPGRVNSSATLPWILAGVGVALIVFGGATAFYMWRKNQHGSPSPRKRHVRILEDDGADAIYCSQCGKRAQAGDVFCRTCGTRLQKEE